MFTEEKKALAFYILPLLLGARSRGGQVGGHCDMNMEAFIDLQPVRMLIIRLMDGNPGVVGGDMFPTNKFMIGGERQWICPPC